MLYEKSSNNIFEQMGEKDSFLLNRASEDILKTTLQIGDDCTQDEFEISIDENVISYLMYLIYDFVLPNKEHIFLQTSSEESQLWTITQDSGIVNDDHPRPESDTVNNNNVRDSHEIEQVDNEFTSYVCDYENDVDNCTQDSGLEAYEVFENNNLDITNNYPQLDQELNRYPVPKLSDENDNTCSIESTKDWDKKEVVSEKLKKEVSKESDSKEKKLKRKGKPFMFNHR